MIKFLRNQKNRKHLLLILAVAVLLPFGFWGVTISREDKVASSSALGMIGKRRISAREYLESYKAVEHRIMLIYGDKIKELKRFLNIKGQAWDRLLLLDYAKQEHIRASDAEIVQWITSQPLFMNKGVFDEGFYKLFVERQLRLQPRQFEEEVRGLITIGKIHDRLKSKVSLTGEELRKRYDEARGQREVAYALLPWETQKAAVQISDDELKSAYEVLKDRLGNPPPAFEASKTKLRETVEKQKTTDAAVKKLQELKAAASADFERIFAAAGAKTGRETIKKSDPISVTAVSGPLLSQVMANLKEGETSEPFPVPEGAMAVKIIRTVPADDKKFSEEKDAFRAESVEKKADEEMDKLLDGLRKRLTLNLEALKTLFPEEDPSLS